MAFLWPQKGRGILAYNLDLRPLAQGLNALGHDHVILPKAFGSHENFVTVALRNRNRNLRSLAIADHPDKRPLA